MKYRKKTNDFDKSILGIDLMIVWFAKQISARLEKRKKKKK